MKLKREKPALDIYDKYSLETILLYDEKVSKWFADLCAGKESKVNVDEEILVQLESRGLVKKRDNYWVLGHDGREFARKLGLIPGPNEIEINPQEVIGKTPKFDKIDIEQIWSVFFETRSEECRNILMTYYLYLVKNIAERIWVKLPDKVDLDDLIQAGIFGLMDAIDAFAPGCKQHGYKLKFEFYCTPRIRGSILDELRSMDWVPRYVRARSHQLERARATLEAQLGRMPTEQELANEMELDKVEFHRLQRDASATGLISLNNNFNDKDGEKEIREIDILEDQRSQNPVTEAQKRDLKNLLTKGLTRAEKMILFLYYYEEMTMKEISAQLDLSESRVSQMHSSVIDRLKTQMSQRENETRSNIFW